MAPNIMLPGVLRKLGKYTTQLWPGHVTTTPPRSQVGLFFGQLGFFVSACLPLVILFKNDVADMTLVTGNSMYPLFNTERDETTRRDLVVNLKWDAQENLQRGMVVVLWHPQKPEEQLIKRIIAVQGDRVIPRSGSNNYPRSSVVIPRAHLWVEGDGDSSNDSNDFGPVSKAMVVGKVHSVIWPWKRFGKLAWWEWPKAENRVLTREDRRVLGW